MDQAINRLVRSNDCTGQNDENDGHASQVLRPTIAVREAWARLAPGEKEGALALGGTQWGVIRDVVLPFGRAGMIGGAMLGLGRALGETVAVTLIISPDFNPSHLVHILPAGGNSIASLIALKFGDSAGGWRRSPSAVLNKVAWVSTPVLERTVVPGIQSSGRFARRIAYCPPLGLLPAFCSLRSIASRARPLVEA
jgi:hypothetical protein